MNNKGICRIIVVLICLFILQSQRNACCLKTRWVRIPKKFTDRELTCIAATPLKPYVLFVGTERHVYKNNDNGMTWHKVFTCSGENKGINDIFIDENNIIYLATKDAIYRSDDLGDTWKVVFDNSVFSRKNIKAILIDINDKDIYVVTDSEVYRTVQGHNSWESFFIFDIPEEHPVEYSPENGVDGAWLEDLTQDEEGVLYLSTGRGLWVSRQRGKDWKKKGVSGLAAAAISSCLVSRKKQGVIHVATNNGIFSGLKEEDVWQNLYSGLTSIRVKGLSYDSCEEKFIWCITKRDIFRSYNKVSDIYGGCLDFINEPSVRRVQEMAIRYTEVNPEKIKRWRQTAAYSAIMPKVTLGVDCSASDTYEIYTNSTKSYFTIGPRDKTEGWDIKLTWDLADLIYNPEQTSIDVRSKLMVQLREDVLNDVTRLYYERRRLQVDLFTNPHMDLSEVTEKEIRLQELTAFIDALTGGEFSANIKPAGTTSGSS